MAHGIIITAENYLCLHARFYVYEIFNRIVFHVA